MTYKKGKWDATCNYCHNCTSVHSTLTKLISLLQKTMFQWYNVTVVDYNAIHLPVSQTTWSLIFQMTRGRGKWANPCNYCYPCYPCIYCRPNNSNQFPYPASHAIVASKHNLKKIRCLSLNCLPFNLISKGSFRPIYALYIQLKYIYWDISQYM